MLEQELHNFNNQDFNNQMPPAARFVAPEKDLFRNYEIKNFELSPRFYKIIAASAIFNVLALLVFAQSNLLTRKGCDSPMVSKVCQVLDTVYIGSVLLGTDTEFASKDYEKTELEDADITYIDVSGQTPPLNYPEGYFAIANPEEYAMRQQQMMNGDISGMNGTTGFTMPPSGVLMPDGSMSSPSMLNQTFPNNDLMNTTPKLPPPNNNPIIGALPNSLGSNPIAKMPPYPSRNIRRPKPLKTPKPEPSKDLTEETAKNEKEEPKKEEPKQAELSSLPVAEDVINKKPFEDLGESVLDKLAKKEIDLSKNFSVEMQGTITKDGKFDKKKSGFGKVGGDTPMVDVAKTAIEKIGDSGILIYLANLGVEKVKFTLVQDDKQIYAIIVSDRKDDREAQRIAGGLNGWLSIGKATVNEEDTLALLKAAEVTNQGKNFVLNFKLDKSIAQEMIKRQLEKAEAKRQQQQPNGTAITKPNENSVK